MYFRAVVIARTRTLYRVCVHTYNERTGRGIYVNVVHVRVTGTERYRYARQSQSQ